VAPPPVAPPGATEASIAAELQRWPAPPGEASREVVVQAWPLYLDLSIWLDEMTAKYSFAEVGETLRHLVFLANGENATTKKAIFLKIRCGRCHAGAGSAGAGITKTDRTLGLFAFQADWCRAVKERSEHPSVEKTIRVICDYYQKACSDDAEAEATLFWRNRQPVLLRLLARAPGQF